MKVSGSPKLGLLKLLIIDSLIREWNDTEIGLSREKTPPRLEEHVACNYVCLKHSLVE